MSFKVGDRVEHLNKLTGICTPGTIVDLAHPGFFYYVILDGFVNPLSANGAFQIITSDLSPIHKYAIPQSGTYNIKFATSITQQNPGTAESTEGWVTYNSGKQESTCAHEFKTYTGLIKKYDYCTKCDVKKNERGAYEN